MVDSSISAVLTAWITSWPAITPRRVYSSARLADLPQEVLEAQAQRRREHRATQATLGDEPHVDLVALGIGGVARIAHALHALLEVDAGELDLARDVGLGLRDLDLARLEDAAMALVLEVLFVRDEVRELLVVAQHDVDRLREPELLEVDVADRRVVDHQVVALTIDRVARLDFDGEIAARARVDLEVTGVPVDHARRVQHAVMQPTLIDVIALGVVPILLGGEEPLEEVDALESLLLLAHDFSSGLPVVA